MGVNGCMMSARPPPPPVLSEQHGICSCAVCPRRYHQQQTIVLPQVTVAGGGADEQRKDKKGSKMKVLKKIKKKIGLAPRTCTSTASTAPNNLPPLTFHRVHGDNLRITSDGATATRVESFCKGVAFSARPVRVNEKVSFRVAEISKNWSGVLRFGFTSVDPASLSHSLPKYACPDLTNKPGYWAKALAERFCQMDNVLHYYVTSSGDVHFGVNGEERGIFFSGVDVRGSLWVLLDIYGNCTEVKFVDPRAPMRRSEDERSLISGISSMSLQDSIPSLSYQNTPMQPLPLHRIKGRNVSVISERLGLVARKSSEFCHGYVFSARPMRPSETLVVQILETESAYSGSLAIGLTSCDPGTLRTCDLPDDAELLLDRPEYWVVRPDAAAGLRRGDELAVTLTPEGEVKVSRNGSNPVTVMHVDHSLRLWAFVDIYGSTQQVRLFGGTVQTPPPPGQLRAVLANARPVNGTAVQTAASTVLVVSLPPQQGSQQLTAYNIEPMQTSHEYIAPAPRHSNAWNHQALTSPSTSQTMLSPSISNGHLVTPIPQTPSCSSQLNLIPTTSMTVLAQNAQNSQPVYSVVGDSAHTTGAECTICYENPIDSVLYMCGHMCMCYRCAVQQWRGQGGGQCPLCRAIIKDVIRTYKS